MWANANGRQSRAKGIGLENRNIVLGHLEGHTPHCHMVQRNEVTAMRRTSHRLPLSGEGWEAFGRCRNSGGIFFAT